VASNLTTLGVVEGTLAPLTRRHNEISITGKDRARSHNNSSNNNGFCGDGDDGGGGGGWNHRMTMMRTRMMKTKKKTMTMRTTSYEIMQ